MKAFAGFPNGKIELTRVPSQFIEQLVPGFKDLEELKLLLYAFWHLEHQEGQFRYLRREDFLLNEHFMAGMGNSETQAQENLERALSLAVEHKIFLECQLKTNSESITLYFLNSPKGRAAVEAIARGEWQPGDDLKAPIEIRPQQANIYRLYEENIGPLTPMIADALRDAEDTYPAKWIEDAVQIAVEKNKRNWRYIAAILESWQRRGRYERKDRQDTEKDRRKYSDW